MGHDFCMLERLNGGRKYAYNDSSRTKTGCCECLENALPRVYSELEEIRWHPCSQSTYGKLDRAVQTFGKRRWSRASSNPLESLH